MPLFSFQFVHALPQLVDQRLLLLLERVLQLNLLTPELLQVVLLDVSLCLELLNLAHELVHQAFLLLLQGLLELHFLLPQLQSTVRSFQNTYNKTIDLTWFSFLERSLVRHSSSCS